MAHRYHRDYCRLLSVSNSDSVANGYSVAVTNSDAHGNTYRYGYRHADGHRDGYGHGYRDGGSERKSDDTDTESDDNSRNTDADTIAKRESDSIAFSHATAHSDHQPVNAHARSHR